MTLTIVTSGASYRRSLLPSLRSRSAFVASLLLMGGTFSTPLLTSTALYAADHNPTPSSVPAAASVSGAPARRAPLARAIPLRAIDFGMSDSLPGASPAASALSGDTSGRSSTVSPPPASALTAPQGAVASSSGSGAQGASTARDSAPVTIPAPSGGISASMMQALMQRMFASGSLGVSRDISSYMIDELTAEYASWRRSIPSSHPCLGRTPAVGLSISFLQALINRLGGQRGFYEAQRDAEMAGSVLIRGYGLADVQQDSGTTSEESAVMRQAAIVLSSCLEPCQFGYLRLDDERRPQAGEAAERHRRHMATLWVIYEGARAVRRGLNLEAIADYLMERLTDPINFDLRTIAALTRPNIISFLGAGFPAEVEASIPQALRAGRYAQRVLHTFAETHEALPDDAIEELVPLLHDGGCNLTVAGAIAIPGGGEEVLAAAAWPDHLRAIHAALRSAPATVRRVVMPGTSGVLDTPLAFYRTVADGNCGDYAIGSTRRHHLALINRHLEHPAVRQVLLRDFLYGDEGRQQAFCLQAERAHSDAGVAAVSLPTTFFTPNADGLFPSDIITQRPVDSEECRSFLASSVSDTLEPMRTRGTLARYVSATYAPGIYHDFVPTGERGADNFVLTSSRNRFGQSCMLNTIAQLRGLNLFVWRLENGTLVPRYQGDYTPGYAPAHVLHSGIHFSTLRSTEVEGDVQTFVERHLAARFWERQAYFGSRPDLAQAAFITAYAAAKELGESDASARANAQAAADSSQGRYFDYATYHNHAAQEAHLGPKKSSMTHPARAVAATGSSVGGNAAAPSAPSAPVASTAAPVALATSGSVPVAATGSSVGGNAASSSAPSAPVASTAAPVALATSGSGPVTPVEGGGSAAPASPPATAAAALGATQASSSVVSAATLTQLQAALNQRLLGSARIEQPKEEGKE